MGDGRENLKRGGVRPEAQAAGRARQERERELGRAVAGNPDDVDFDEAVNERQRDPVGTMFRTHDVLAEMVTRLGARSLRGGRTPDRQMVDLLKEFRQANAQVTEYLQARGALAQGESFLATMDVRLETLADVIAANPDGVQPLVEPPPAPEPEPEPEPAGAT